MPVNCEKLTMCKLCFRKRVRPLIRLSIKKFVVDYLYNERAIKKHQF